MVEGGEVEKGRMGRWWYGCRDFRSKRRGEKGSSANEGYSCL